MRIMLLAAASIFALTGVAVAQEGGRHDLFQADSNSDGALTRAEFDAGRDAMFARVDANNDGQLSRDEHRGGRHRGRRGMRHMSAADANGDGAISRDEFLARPLEMFRRLDSDSDGSVSPEEQTQMRARHQARGQEAGEERHHGGEGHSRPNPDANGDRQISRAEFAAMGAAHFDRLDANDDSRVTREEAEAAHGRRRGR